MEKENNKGVIEIIDDNNSENLSIENTIELVRKKSFMDMIEKDDESNRNNKNNSNDSNDKIKGQGFYYSYEMRLGVKVFLSIIFICASIVTFFLIDREPSIVESNYQITGTADYKVYLKENNFYEEDILGSNMKYIASLIDKIEFNYDYKFFSPSLYDLKYSYYITANLKVYDSKNSNKVIYQNEEVIVPKKEKSINNTNFRIMDNVDIDYNSYNELIKNFKSEYGLYVNSDVVYTLHIDLLGIHNEIKENISENSTIKLTIPLTQEMVDIDLKNNDIKVNKNISGISETDQKKNNIIMIIFLVLLLISVFMVVNTVIFLLKSRHKKSKYQEKIDKILKEYDRAIAKTKEIIEITAEHNVIEMETFEGLLDIRDNLNLPILFMEVHKGSKAWFVIKKDNDIYRYVLKGVDLGDK